MPPVISRTVGSAPVWSLRTERWTFQRQATKKIRLLYDREYDCANLAWISEVVSDPEQIWHSKWVEGRSSNHCGMNDKRVDELIEE